MSSVCDTRTHTHTHTHAYTHKHIPALSSGSCRRGVGSWLEGLREILKSVILVSFLCVELPYDADF